METPARCTGRRENLGMLQELKEILVNNAVSPFAPRMDCTNANITVSLTKNYTFMNNGSSTCVYKGHVK